MTVPEAAVHEQYSIQLRKYHIRAARQSRMQPVAETGRMQTLPKDKLWFRVLAANAGHHTAADFFSDYVSHLLRGASAPAAVLPS